MNKLVLDPVFISNVEKNKMMRLTRSSLFFDNMKAKMSFDKKNILLSMQGRIYLVSVENRPVMSLSPNSEIS